MNSIEDSLNRIEQILMLPQKININSIASNNISVSFNGLRQLFVEKLIDGESAFNNQPTLHQFLDFGGSLATFFDSDTDLQLQFFGSISCVLNLNQVNFSLDSFELAHKEKNVAMDNAVQLLPIISKFVCQYKADEFVLSNTRFFGWWD